MPHSFTLDDRPCPECGGVLELHLDVEIGVARAHGFHLRGAPLERVAHRAPAVLCTGCEFCIEIRRSDFDSTDRGGV